MYLRVHCFQTQLIELSGTKLFLLISHISLCASEIIYMCVLQPRIIRKVTQRCGHLGMLYHISGELPHLTPSLRNSMYFLSPQFNSNCSSHYCLLLAKLCWLCHSTHFLSLRGMFSTPGSSLEQLFHVGSLPFHASQDKEKIENRELEVKRPGSSLPCTITCCPTTPLLCDPVSLFMKYKN